MSERPSHCWTVRRSPPAAQKHLSRTSHGTCEAGSCFGRTSHILLTNNVGALPSARQVFRFSGSDARSFGFSPRTNDRPRFSLPYPRMPILSNCQVTSSKKQRTPLSQLSRRVELPTSKLLVCQR